MAEIASFGVNVDQNTRLAQNAQDTANDANVKNSANSQQIANINDPNYLTPFEKPQLEIQMDNFATIYKTDKDIAEAEGIDFTAYDAAYQAYLAYMTPLIADMTTYGPIVRSTFNGMVTAVQVEQKRFNAATQAQYSQQINKAKTDIDDGQTKYKALQSEAETMKSSVAGISDEASKAISSAGFASNAASTASQAANEANQAASSAVASALAAQDNASSAVATANSTASEFGKVSKKADSAFDNATSAQSAASSAVAQASSAAADSKDAKQIAGAVSQSYKTLTDGSTMTIAELEGGLAVKLTKSDLNGYATEAWSQNQIKVTADGINNTMSNVKSTVDSQATSINDLQADSRGFKTQFQTVNDNIGQHTTDIAKLQVTAKGLQSTVSDKVSSDQLTQLSGLLTTQIKDLSTSTNSKFTQTSNDINAMVKKGDVVNQFNIDTGGALLQTVGDSTKIVFSSPNIIFDTNNPVQIPNANIPGKLTGKTIEFGTITATTKITGADIEAPLIHSPSGSFKLDGNTGDIIGASIHSADGSWGITANGKISGASVTSSMIDISGDGSGPDFDAENVTPDTTTGIYSRYKYANPNVGFDVNGFGRKMYKNGYLVINGDTFLNRTIGDWSADGGGKYVYDTMYEANVIKMRAYNYTGSNVQTDDPSKTQGVISSRLDIQPSAITMGPNFSVGNPNILIYYTGRIKGGLIATNAAHSIGTTDGGDLYFMQMNKDATNVDGSSIRIHVKGIYTSNLSMNNAHTIASADGGGIYLKDHYSGAGNMVDLHVKKLYQSSLLSLKTDIKPIDPHKALTEVVKNDVMGYHFKNDKTTDPKSVSVILDDINPIPKYYTSDVFKSADGTGRNDGNIVGYLMLSIKDLNSRLQKLEGAN